MSGGWRDQAACRAADPALFCAPEGEEPEEAAAREAEANTYCSRCPVRSACLEFGLTQRYGHWGGMGERERLLHGRRRRRAEQKARAA
jgi:WhiB family redox-sensing transcriptional regulator